MSWHTLYQDMVAVVQGEHAQTAAQEACKLSWACTLQGVRCCIAEMEVCFSKFAGAAAVQESFHALDEACNAYTAIEMTAEESKKKSALLKVRH